MHARQDIMAAVVGAVNSTLLINAVNHHSSQTLPHSTGVEKLHECLRLVTCCCQVFQVLVTLVRPRVICHVKSQWHDGVAGNIPDEHCSYANLLPCYKQYCIKSLCLSNGRT